MASNLTPATANGSRAQYIPTYTQTTLDGATISPVSALLSNPGVISVTKEESTGFELIHLKDNGLLKWMPNFMDKQEAAALYTHLATELNWVHGDVPYGKATKKTPRLQSWMADEWISVTTLFQKQRQHPWTPPVMALKQKLEKALGCTFDYVLLNQYRDGKDCIGFHTDGEAIPEGKNIIASISLGQARRFIMKHKHDKGCDMEFLLTDGSLIVMAADTQKSWRHGIPKEPQVTEPRINMTFRIN